MDYYGIGFSNIRLPNDSRSYIYKYNSRINTFPEEVFLHEFLHSLERNAQEYGYDRPELHDYEKYGYEKKRADRLRSKHRRIGHQPVSVRTPDPSRTERR